MGEELVTEAGAVSGSLDEPGNVRNSELSLVRAVHDAEHGLEGREWVVGDLGLRVRDASKEGRLARIGQSGERRVDHELQTEIEPELVTGRPVSTKRGVCRVGVANRALRPPGPRVR